MGKYLMAFLVLAGPTAALASTMPWIRVHGSEFHREGQDEEPMKFWGFNYDHDDAGRLLEDYWRAEWPVVEEDFQEMKSLGANVVRIHLQLGQFMVTPTDADSSALERLSKLVALAESTQLYLDVTGLGCYHKADVPEWYDELSEADRWMTQARFWSEVARVCRDSPAVLCYDLMNEPVLPGKDQTRTDWLAGDFAGKHFVQYISLDLKERTREEVAKAWIGRLTSAIRQQDTNHLITVGVIPWAMVFPGAKPIFYGSAAGNNLDFVSVHFYPDKGGVDKALKALAVYDVGKPLVIEEIFPLKCGLDELDEFVEKSRVRADGWMGFYWGKTREEYAVDQGEIKSALIKAWLDYFARKAPSILSTSP